MKLEVGKSYRTHAGRKATIEKKLEGIFAHDPFPFEGKVQGLPLKFSWNEPGACKQGIANDLVAEWLEEESYNTGFGQKALNAGPPLVNVYPTMELRMFYKSGTFSGTTLFGPGRLQQKFVTVGDDGAVESEWRDVPNVMEREI